MFSRLVIAKTSPPALGSAVRDSIGYWCFNKSLYSTEPPANVSFDQQRETFRRLLETSRLLSSCGSSPVNQTVLGEIIAVVDGHMYVDFGGKFHGVAKVPEKNANSFVKGVKVDVVLKDLEQTSHFLGKSRDTSLLEAEIELVGLARAKDTPKTPSGAPPKMDLLPDTPKPIQFNSLLDQLTDIEKGTTKTTPSHEDNCDYF